MAQFNSAKGTVKTFRAGDTLTAGLVVAHGGASTTGVHVDRWLTDTSVIIGVCLGAASLTGEAVDILLAAPTCKALVLTDVAAGDIVGPATAGTGIVPRANPGTVTTFMVPTLGIALEAGSVSSLVEVLLQPVSTRPSDG